MMRRSICLLSILLFGCTQGYPDLASPDVTTVFSYSEKLSSLSGAKIVDGGDLVAAAYYVVDDRCEKFFDQLERHKSELLFAHSLATDGTSLTVQVMTQLSAAQRDIGIVAAAGKFISDTIQNYNTVYYFAPYSGQLHKLVAEAQAQYKNSTKPTLQELSGHPINESKVFFTAANVAQGYARLCTYTQFQLFVETALNKANAVSSTSSTNTKVQTVDPAATNGEASDMPERPIIAPTYLPPYISG